MEKAVGHIIFFSGNLSDNSLFYLLQTSLLLGGAQTKKKRLHIMKFELLFGGHLSISLKMCF